MKYIMSAAFAVLMLMTFACASDKDSSDTSVVVADEAVDTNAETTPSDTSSSDTGTTTGEVKDTDSDTNMSDQF